MQFCHEKSKYMENNVTSFLTKKTIELINNLQPPIGKYIVHANVLNDTNTLRYGKEITTVNGERLPDFMSLDVRANYNIFTNWGVFSAFVDLGDVTNRFNVNTEVFLPNTGKVYNIGFGIFPTFGIRTEF
ncbi:hypothetical protein ACG2LH_17260 [Zhouia sp. PK063]|uniref:hypothetical protein n=1 Tax=Zhouia sp. PK063 TaxID=3373602 RepID=UPI0037B6DDD0